MISSGSGRWRWAGSRFPELLRTRATAAEAGIGEALKDKAVVVLFLAGGASHIETFDPRMDAPDGVRSVTGEVATTIPGVTFGGTFPALAARRRSWRSSARSVTRSTTTRRRSSTC